MTCLIWTCINADLVVKVFHADCLGIEPDSQLDVDYMSWWNDETDVEMDRWEYAREVLPFM